MSTTDDSDTKPDRRTILSAVGSLVGLPAVSGNTIARDDECPERDLAEGGQTLSLPCGELPEEYHEADTDPWYESSITFQNCSTCARLINGRVTEGHISENNEEEPHESDQTRTLGYTIGAGERKTFWYTGSIRGLDVEPSDMNISISQRSIEHAEGPQCYRPSAASEMDQDTGCPEENPTEKGQTLTLRCEELPEEYHEADTDPWYESSITFQNCSSCIREIAVSVTGGHIHEDNIEEPHESDQTTSISYQIDDGERKTFWFTGSVNFLNLSEHSDMNVAINQRSVEHASSSRCYRP